MTEVLVVDLTPRVVLSAPSVPSFIAERMIVESARHFCRLSGAFVKTTPYTTTSGLITIPIVDDVLEILDVREGGRIPLQATTEAQLHDCDHDWETKMGDGRFYVRTDRNVIRIVPQPQDGTSFTVDASYMPVRSAEGLDGALVDDHEDTIIEGALGMLLSQPNQEWTSLQLGAHYIRDAHSAALRARSRRDSRRTHNATRVVEYGGY